MSVNSAKTATAQTPIASCAKLSHAEAARYSYELGWKSEIPPKVSEISDSENTNKEFSDSSSASVKEVPNGYIPFSYTIPSAANVKVSPRQPVFPPSATEPPRTTTRAQRLFRGNLPVRGHPYERQVMRLAVSNPDAAHSPTPDAEPPSTSCFAAVGDFFCGSSVASEPLSQMEMQQTHDHHNSGAIRVVRNGVPRLSTPVTPNSLLGMRMEVEASDQWETISNSNALHASPILNAQNPQ